MISPCLYGHTISPRQAPRTAFPQQWYWLWTTHYITLLILSSSLWRLPHGNIMSTAFTMNTYLLPSLRATAISCPQLYQRSPTPLSSLLTADKYLGRICARVVRVLGLPLQNLSTAEPFRGANPHMCIILLTILFLLRVKELTWRWYIWNMKSYKLVQT